MTITVDLKRQPQVADLISDLDMGAPVAFQTTLKSKNGEIAEFTLERAEEGKAADDKNDDGDEGVDEDEAESVNTGNGAGGSANTPGGSKEQDRMAAALTAQT